MKSVNFIETLLIIVETINIVFGLTCRNSKECGICGFCVDQKSSGPECYSPFQNFRIEKNQCYPNTLCVENYCKNNGECKMSNLFQSPYCICNNSKHFSGQYCDIKWDEFSPVKWFSGIGVAFNNEQINTDLNSINPYGIGALAIVSYSGENLHFFLDTKEGYTIRFNRSTPSSSFLKSFQVFPYKSRGLCQTGCSFLLPKYTFVYVTKVLFPYKLTLGPEMLSRSGKFVGYLSNVTVIAKTFNKGNYIEVFRYTYPIVVNYEDIQPKVLKQIPDIEIINCASNLEDRVYYSRKSTISLNSRVRNTIKGAITPTWAIYNVEKFRYEYNDPERSQTNEGFSWILEPYTIDLGVYRVELKVTSILDTQSAFNFAECFIEVHVAGLKAIISGGFKITVNKSKNMVISAEKSYNPNNPEISGELSFSWSCEPQCDDLVQKAEFSYGLISISNYLLEKGKQYNFTVTVSAPGFQDVDSTYQEVFVSDNAMNIACLMNCLEMVVPSDPIFLEAKLSKDMQTQHTFVWTATEENGSEITVGDIKCKGYDFPSYLLCVEPYTLNNGGSYYLKAEMKDDKASAGVKVTVGHSLNFTCTVTPSQGVQFETLFTITCSKPGNRYSILTFEYFDKNESDLLEYSGRMLAINNLGILKDFRVTRGTIIVYVYDINGIISQFKHVVELLPFNATQIIIENWLAEIENMIINREMDLALRKASLVSELIGFLSDKKFIVTKMVDIFSKINFDTQSKTKFGLLTFHNFINSLTKDSGFKTMPSMLSSFLKIINALTNWTKYVSNLSLIAIPPISKGMLEQMTVISVSSIEMLFESRNESFFNINLEDLIPSDYEDALDASINFEFCLNHIGYALGLRQANGFVLTSLTSISERSVISSLSDYVEIIAQKINKNEEFPLKLSRELTKELKYIKELTVQMTELKYNPFWAGRRDISTNLISLNMYHKYPLSTKMVPIDYIRNNVDLFLNVLNSNVSQIAIKVTQILSNTENIQDMDKRVKVIRIDLDKQSNLYIGFSFLNSTDEVKVYISDELRPDYELVNSSKTIMSSTNPNISSPVSGSESSKFVYIGILPGPKVPNNGSVYMTVHLYYHQCLMWFRHNWVAEYCRVGSSSNTSVIHCKCSHLSFFSAIFAIPPNNVDIFNDIELFLTLKHNLFIVALIICILLIFFVIGIWARCNDARDKVRSEVIVLEDNFPDDENIYLLAVSTGCRINAGTGANVGVKIHGSESSSHSHILKSTKRIVLRYNSEDWFLIRTPNYLGVISQIHIWHDNSGTSPDWYCNKIVIYDLKTSVVYTFFVEQWLALEVDEYCEAVLFPATSEDLSDFRRIFQENVAYGFRNASMSGGIIARYPRSRINRLDRVVILMSFIFLALLISIAFYKVPIDDDEGVDDFGISYRTQDLLISIQTFIITSIIILLITYSFIKSYKSRSVRSVDNVSSLYIRPVSKNPFLVKESSDTTLTTTSDEKTLYQRVVKRVQSTFSSVPLYPVTLSKPSSKGTKRRILYFFTWLVSVLLILFCLFFIILYGLKLGEAECKNWIISITLVIIEQFLIISPLKVVFIAFVLTSALERFVQISNYSVKVEDFLQHKIPTNNLYFSLLLERRKHSMYRPISITNSEILRRKRRIMEIWQNILALLIVIIYMIIICLVTYDYSITIQSHTNLHIAQITLNPHKRNLVNFKDIYNRTLYYDYLDYSLVRSLYAIKWYNNKNLNPSLLNSQLRSKWWLKDNTMKLVGPPLCRQLRVDPKKCSLNQITEKSSMECIPNWSPNVEDNDDYAYGWKIATYEDIHDDESSPWKYVPSYQSNRYSRHGETWTMYHGGGYMVDLSSDKFETERVLQILTESKWIDEFTRVVFLDFTLFNVNEKMFTEVVLIAEHLPYGLYITRTIISSVQLYLGQSIWNERFVLFIVIILFHVLKMLWLINRTGFVKYFSKFSNIYQLLVTVLGVLSVSFFVVHLKVSLDYIEEFQRRGLEVFFDFDTIVYYSIMSSETMTILFCCLSFQMFSLWPFGGSSLNIYRTLLTSGKSIARFLIFFFVYIIMFYRLISYLLYSMLSFSTFYWHWTNTVYEKQSIKDAILVFILSFSVKLCLVYILMLFFYQYKLGRTKKAKHSDLTVVFNWLKGLIRNQ